MLHLVWVKLVSQTFLKLLVLYLQIHMLSKKSPDLVSAKFPQLFGFAVCNSEWLKSWCGISMDILNLIYQNVPILAASREIFSILLWQNRQFFRRRLSQHQSQGEVVIGLAMDRWKKQDLHISNVWSESKSMESMDPLSLNMFWFSIDLCCQVETKVVDIIFAYICLIFTSYYWWKKSCTRQGEGSSFYVFICFYMFLLASQGVEDFLHQQCQTSAASFLSWQVVFDLRWNLSKRWDMSPTTNSLGTRGPEVFADAYVSGFGQCCVSQLKHLYLKQQQKRSAWTPNDWVELSWYAEKKTAGQK